MKPMVRVRAFPLIISYEIFNPWIFLFLAVVSAAATSSVGAKISFPDHCNSAVAESVPSSLTSDPLTSIQLSSHYFSTDQSPSQSFIFRSKPFRNTNTPGVHYVSGTLTLTLPKAFPHRKVIGFRPRSPHILNPWPKVNFELAGFWSESSGILCMVGSGLARRSRGGTTTTTTPELSVLFKLNYPNTSSITTSLVGGTVHSLDSSNSSYHFDPISFLAYTQKDYRYTRISGSKDLCSFFKFEGEPLGFEKGSFCSDIHVLLREGFKLDYGRNCSSGHCGLFSKSVWFLPTWMLLKEIHCSEDGKLHMFIGFSNRSGIVFHNILVPGESLVGEGMWDEKTNRLCIVVCRVMSNKDPLLLAHVDDCTIGLCLWFPAALTIENRTSVVGRIWSTRDENDPGFFDMVSFRSSEKNFGILPRLQYNYTKMDVLNKYCLPDNPRRAGKKRYPDGKSYADMRFRINVRSTTQKKGRNVLGKGSATPFSIGHKFYARSYQFAPTVQLFEINHTLFSIGHTFYARSYQFAPAVQISEINHSLWNVSYELSYNFLNASAVANERIYISAEGIYNARTGLLCMVGCQYRGSAVKGQVKNEQLDCEILINIQFSPLNPKAGEHLTGTIKSMRGKLDPLYFEPLEISSHVMYTRQAVESIWRIGIEIAMVLISLTLSCIFIWLQLYYVNRHPDVLPSISITMLIVLTLGHTIPLLLNFKALFFVNPNRQNALLSSGGWLEVNEFLVKIITMIAFLLTLRLLQVVWSARSVDDGKTWVAQRRTLMLCLPLYFAGGLIALFVHFSSSKSKLQSSQRHHSLWEDMMSYAGLIFDGFLLPQVILNVYLNSKNEALATSFYIGTTIVRAMPHVYDAYRAHHYMSDFKSSYIYASPYGDFYSYAWDVIIPCGALLFAVLIYSQQRFGGTFSLSLKSKQPGEYELVPVACS